MPEQDNAVFSFHTVTIDSATDRRLRMISEELGMSVERLIANSAEEAALDYFRHRDDDPARDKQEQFT